MSSGASTYGMQMQPLGNSPGSAKPSSLNGHPISSPPSSQREDYSLPGSLPAPNSAVPVLQRWNQPRVNVFRVFACFYSFVILGANDGAYGALIPYLEEYYGINYTVISLVFLSPVGGYMASALLNNKIHMLCGQRGLAVLMACMHIIAYVLICLHIPYAALVVSFIVAGFGNGLGDSAWNAWIGDMQNPNEVLGFLHASYGLGAALAPLIATSLVTKAGWMWYEYYYIMVGAAVIELIILTIAFWGADAEHFRIEHPQTAGTVSGSPTDVDDVLVQENGSPGRDTGRLGKFRSLFSPSAKPSRPSKSRTLEAVKNKVTVLASVFLLVYVGIEVSVGGWIVVFMLRIRHGSRFASGLVSTGFWLGVTMGRIVLGFVTGRVFRSEKWAVATYLVISVVLQLLFWLIPSFLVSAVMIALEGFFLAPMFPAAVVAITKLLPKAQHVAAVGFAAALGASGACIFPFAVGAIANAKGVQVLQPIVLAMLVALLGVWMLIPKLPKSRTA